LLLGGLLRLLLVRWRALLLALLRILLGVCACTEAHCQEQRGCRSC
jgi:hypothetical protein